MTANSLIYRCPHCQTTVEVPPELTGQVVVCSAPGCGQPFKADLPVASPAAPNPLATNGVAQTAPAPTAPVAAAPTPAPAPAPPQPTLPPEVPLEVVRVSMWRRYPLRCLLYLLLTVASAIGIIVCLLQGLNVMAAVCAGVLVVVLVRFVPWWLRTRNTTLTITDRRCVLETGIFHRQATEFDRGNLVDVQVAQGGLMRLLNVGDLVISSDPEARKQFVLMAVPDPATVASHLRDLKLGHERHAEPQVQHA
jgi:membrane protein YdbS with pleckstrin-like domain